MVAFSIGHIFINIFQTEHFLSAKFAIIFVNVFQTEHFLTVKFATGYEKNMNFLVILKSPKVRKKLKKIGLGSFKGVLHPKPKINIFCALSQNYQHLYEK